MSLITRGFGVINEAIITQGYGINIEEIIIEAIESVTRRKVVGKSSSKRKDYIKDEEKYEEYTIFASLISSNDQQLSIPISNEIKKRIENSSAINIKIEDIEVNINKKEIEVKVILKSSTQKNNKSIKIDAKKLNKV